MDRGFGDVRRYPPGSHAGILVLRLDDQAAPALAAAVEDLLDSVDDPAGCVAVYCDGDVRVRRPPGRG
jgi:NADPH-dependent ferric siderophore reductase